jgi:hypothetical protein
MAKRLGMRGLTIQILHWDHWFEEKLETEKWSYRKKNTGEFSRCSLSGKVGLPSGYST